MLIVQGFVAEGWKNTSALVQSLRVTWSSEGCPYLLQRAGMFFKVPSNPAQMFYDSTKCFKTLQKSFVPCPCFRLNIQCIDSGITMKSPSTLTGEKPDPDQTFKLTSLQNFSSCLPNTCTTVVSNHNISHRQPESVLMETPQDTIVSFAHCKIIY